MSASTARPHVLRYAAGAALLTVAPVFAWLGFVATRERPPRAQYAVGRWVAPESGPGGGGGGSGGARSRAREWRLAVNRFNMVKLEAPDGRAVKGRLVFAASGNGGNADTFSAAATDADAGADSEVVRVESVWGAAGLAVGLGFAPVALEVVLWPASAAAGAALAVAGVGGSAGEADGAPLPGARDLVFVREEAAAR